MIASKIFRSAIKLIMGMIIFVSLPLVGWGVRDFQGFFRHPVRFAYMVLITFLQVVVVIALPEVGLGSGEGKQLVRRQRIAVLLLQILSLAIVLTAPYCDHWDVATLGDLKIIRYAGLAFFVFGFIVMNWAEVSLGKQFSVQVTLQDKHELVTGGLYRYLRHPRYLGIIVFNLGIAFIFRAWFAVVLMMAVAGVLLWRIHDEEVLMRQTFGVKWESYTRRSWRLIPFVY